MRKDFNSNHVNELQKIFVGSKLPLYLVKKMEKYHGKCKRSQFIEIAIIEKIANLEYQKQIKKN